MDNSPAETTSSMASRKALACAIWIGLGTLAVVPLRAGVAAESELEDWPPAPLPSVRQMIGVKSPMRDGVNLVSDIWLPQGDGSFPVVLKRTPYDRGRGFAVPDLTLKLARKSVAQGIGFVHQDVRGRGDSEGRFSFLSSEGKDGYDTIEWIANQPWSNGQVAMIGGSYLGTAQWLAARERPPHLTCLFSQAAALDYFSAAPYSGGAFNLTFSLGAGSWPMRVSGRIMNNAVADSQADLDAVWSHRPLMTADLVRGRELTLVRQFLEHPTFDDWWKNITVTDNDFSNIDVPAFHVTGWFDGQLRSTTMYWRGMRAHSPARDKQRLIIGPWTHAETGSGGTRRLGDIERGEPAVVDMDGLALSWFKTCFAGTTAEFGESSARVFLTGVNQWLDLGDYPPPATSIQRLYLQSDGQANQSRGGAGRLTPDAPDHQLPDRYTFNPRNPVTASIAIGDLQDSDGRDERDDILVYKSPPFGESVAVLGPVTLTLFVATSARDTDFVADIYDIDDRGRAKRLTWKTAILRTRYRSGFDKQVLMTPNAPTELTLEFFDIGHVFVPGHSLRLEISSSAPDFNPNQNTGHDVATDVQWTEAKQTVFHDHLRPSYLTLPIIDLKHYINLIEAETGSRSATTATQQ